MIKWAAFATGAVVWIGICWFFGNMAGGTAAGPRGSIAQQQCAERRVAEGRAVDFFAARDSDECIAAQRAAFRTAAAPAQRKGLLIGLLPVLLIGGLMAVRARG